VDLLTITQTKGALFKEVTMEFKRPEEAEAPRIAGTESGAGTGSMDTCAARSSPSYTGDAFFLEG
jgi:hypothetical protein